jgi:hypothetical protein
MTAYRSFLDVRDHRARWLRSELHTRQSLRRWLLGRTFNQVPRLVLRLNYKNTQCGFRDFTRRKVRTRVVEIPAA